MNQSTLLSIVDNGKERSSFVGFSALSKKFYKRIYVCDFDGKRFRSVIQLENHYSNWSHRQHKKMRYSIRKIDGVYIKEIKENCQKNEVIAYCRFCGEMHNLKQSCYNRLCEKCEPIRLKRIAKKKERVIQQFIEPKFLTLTMQGHHEFSRDSVKELNESWKRLYKIVTRVIHKPFSYSKQMEFKKKSDGWYYHLHVVVDLPFIPQTDWSTYWSRATKGSSFVVWIESMTRFRDPQRQKLTVGDVINYVSKYLSKPMGLIREDWPNDLKMKIYDTFAREIYGRHFSHTHLTTSLDLKGNLESESIFKNNFLCKKCQLPLKVVTPEMYEVIFSTFEQHAYD